MGISSNTQYFRRIDTTYSTQCAIFAGSVLLSSSNTQYFRGIDTTYTKQCAVFPGINIAYINQYAIFSEDRYYLYSAVRSFFEGSVLLTLSNTVFWAATLRISSNAQYFRGIDASYTKQYAVFSGVDTAYIKQYAVFSGDRYYLY